MSLHVTKLGGNNYTLSVYNFILARETGELMLNPPFQRGSVWTVDIANLIPRRSVSSFIFDYFVVGLLILRRRFPKLKLCLRGEKVMVNFDVTKEESELILKIAQRVIGMLKWDPKLLMDIEMDLTATHANGCPLDLEGLLKADNFNLTHDIIGIRQHLNRETGELEGGFLPRYND